jgi:hypothetical protein
MWPRFSVAASALGTAAILCQNPIQSAEDFGAGRRIYTVLCAQCHGVDGDAVSYADIVPIAGIKRRYPPEVIRNLSGRFSARVLAGLDQERIVEYLRSLNGAKGFPDPGWLVTPYLLERKAPRVHEFRVLDTRSKEAYRAGHAANAVSIESGSCLTSAEDTAEWLGHLGVTPTTMVVVYDEIGGPSAACVWWRIRRAGHQWIAVLDGGWRKWTAEGRFTTVAVPKVEPTTYPAARLPASHPVPGKASVLPLAADGWNWASALDQDGFRRYEELVRLVESAGLRPGATFRVEGAQEQLAHLTLTLHVLGYDVDYDARAAILSLKSQ